MARIADHLAAVSQRWRWTALVVVAVAQAVALYGPGVPGPTTDLPLDKVTHFLLFATVAAAAVWAGVPWLAVAVLLVGQALASELVQHFWLSDRGGEWGDGLADMLGIAAGLVLGQRFLRRQPTVR